MQGASTTTTRSTTSSTTVSDLDRVRGTGGNHAFYLSIPPAAFPVVIKQLARSGLAAQDAATSGAGW